MMIVRGVNVFPSQIEEQILVVPGLSPHYQIELSKVRNLDQLKVNCEVSDSSVDTVKTAEILARQIKDFIGISVAVNIVQEGRMPRSQGKAQRVIDLRNRD